MIRSDTLKITPEILALIAGIDEFKGAWRALGAIRRLLFEIAGARQIFELIVRCYP